MGGGFNRSYSMRRGMVWSELDRETSARKINEQRKRMMRINLKNRNQYVAVDERRRLRRVGRNTENGRHDEPSTSPNHVSHLGTYMSTVVAASNDSSLS